jgi:hypothetical protein
MMSKGIIVPTIGTQTGGWYEKWKKGRAWTAAHVRTLKSMARKKKAGGENREEPKTE